MNNSKKKTLLQKEKGAAGVMDFIPVLMMVVFGAWIFIQAGLQLRYLDILNRLENITGKYMMIMVTRNGMTAEELEKFYGELEEIGISGEDIDMEGTTFWDGNIEYGDEIYLKVRLKVPYKRLFISENMKHVIKTGKKDVRIEKCGVALA